MTVRPLACVRVRERPLSRSRRRPARGAGSLRVRCATLCAATLIGKGPSRCLTQKNLLEAKGEWVVEGRAF